MSTFKPDKLAAQREVDAVFLGGSGAGRATGRREGLLNEFAREIERIAKSLALVGYGADPSRPEVGGELRNSIHVRIRGGIPLEVFVEASRTRVWNGEKFDVAKIINLGHREIRPRPNNRKGKGRYQPRGAKAGKYVYYSAKNPVRQVGEYPFLWEALVRANAALPSGTRFKLTRTQKGLSGAPPARAKF